MFSFNLMRRRTPLSSREISYAPSTEVKLALWEQFVCTGWSQFNDFLGYFIEWPVKQGFNNERAVLQ